LNFWDRVRWGLLSLAVSALAVAAVVVMDHVLPP
jgi:hypothetical protein